MRQRAFSSVGFEINGKRIHEEAGGEECGDAVDGERDVVEHRVAGSWFAGAV